MLSLILASLAAKPNAGIFDASSSGNLLFHGSFTSAKTIASGDILKVASGSLTITAN